MNLEIDKGREALKSILTCIDEHDFSKLRQELKQFRVILDPLVARFLGALAALILDEFKDAVVDFEDLIDDLHRTRTFKDDFRAKLLSAFCTPFWLNAKLADSSNDSSFHLDSSLSNYESLDKIALSLDEEFPRYRELVLSRDLMFFILSVKTLMLSGREYENFENFLLPEINQSKPVELNAVELFDNRTEKDNWIDLLVQLCSLSVFRLICYDAYSSFLQRTWKPDTDTAKKEKFVLAIRDIVKRIEPTTQNEKSNRWLYLFLKPSLNKLAFRYYIESGLLSNGFEWIESYVILPL